MDTRRSYEPDADEATLLKYAGWAYVPRVRQIQGEFLTRFRRERDLYWGALDRLVLSHAELGSSKLRIRAAIQLIATYSGWYAISAHIAFKVPAYALTLALVIACGITASPLAHSHGLERLVWLAVASIAAASISFVAWRARSYRLRRLVIAVIALFIVVSLGSHFETIQPKLLVVYMSSLADCVMLIVGFGFSWAMFRQATAARLKRYPDDEIIQSLLVAMYHASRRKLWERNIGRRIFVVDLEWIARRLERECPGSFCVGDDVRDFDINMEGAKRASAVRLWKSAVAFPLAATSTNYLAFLEKSLTKAAASKWGELDEAEVTVSSRKSRVKLVIEATVKAFFPIALAVITTVALRAFTHAYDDLMDKICVFAAIWAALALLRSADPQNFDAQIQAARTLKDAI